IRRVMADETSKAWSQRTRQILFFLHKEEVAHSLALVELEGVLRGSTEHGENTIPVLKRERIIDGMITAENGDGKAQMARRVYRIAAWEGLGDVLLLTPAIRTIKKLYPDCKVHVYCASKAHKKILVNNKHIDRLLTLGALGRFILLYLKRYKLVPVER